MMEDKRRILSLLFYETRKNFIKMIESLHIFHEDSEKRLCCYLNSSYKLIYLFASVFACLALFENYLQALVCMLYVSSLVMFVTCVNFYL